MKHVPAIFLMLLSVFTARSQDVYASNRAVISFFSSAPIEDVKAESSKAVAAIDIRTRAVYFKVQIRSFQFRKSLMQEHFNEKYLESDKYPYAEFKGRILDDVDLSKDGEYTVNVQGNLNIHNVIKQYTTKALLKVKQGKIESSATFNVKLVDHQITIPTLLTENIAEVMEVKVSGILAPRASNNDKKTNG